MINFDKEKMMQRLEVAKNVGVKTAKYGLVFTSGILTGTLCGFALFFYISKDKL